MLLLATLIGVPVGFFGAIYLAEFSGGTTAFVVRYAADLLNGVPSIVIGIFAYSIVVLPSSIFHARRRIRSRPDDDSITLRSTEEFLRAVPPLCAKRPWRLVPASGKRSSP